MSYVVKGYKFPQSCRECWLMSREVGDSYSCIFTGKYWEFLEDQPSKSRLPECPLVELPTPHGRLIDADKLLESFREALNEDRCFVDFFALVDDSPTVIEAEVSE